MSAIQAVLNEFMPCSVVCPGCEVVCQHGDGRTPDVDRMADALIEARDARGAALALAKSECDNNDTLRTQLAAARVVTDAMVERASKAYCDALDASDDGQALSAQVHDNTVICDDDWIRAALTAALSEAP